MANVATSPQDWKSQARLALPGSEKQPFQPAVSLGTAANAVSESAPLPLPAKSRARVTVSVLVRPREPFPPAEGGVRLSHAQFAKRYGADPASVKLVQAFAAAYGLTAQAPEPGRRTVLVSGSQGALAEAFGVAFEQHEQGGQPFRTRSGPIMLPASLAEHVTAVLGLDDRPQARPHFRVAKPRATNTSYSPAQVAQLYGLPVGAMATGQTIAILELGGGYRKADLTAYFKSLGLPVPSVTAVSVDGGKNTPGNANGADGEVMLDIEVCGAVAQGAKLVVYFAPNTDQGFIDAISSAVHDQTHKPGVLSISWGGPEASWTAQARTALDQACQAAAALGVTITVAAGDNGSIDSTSGTANQVDFPASSPHVLACGGTKLVASGAQITSQVVWNELAANEGATGGGVSNVFPLPSWQAAAGVPKPATAAGGRGVPDVSGDADPATGYDVRVDGQTTVIGGTSAVAPLWAALIAIANSQRKTALGFVNPTLYGSVNAFRDITSGSNGGFNAGPGWDACTGLGSPNVPALLPALSPTTARSPRQR